MLGLRGYVGVEVLGVGVLVGVLGVWSSRVLSVGGVGRGFKV